MIQNSRSRKRGPSVLPIAFFVLFALFSAADEIPEEFIVLLIVLIVLAVFGVFLWIGIKSVRARKELPAHSHDRIDHSSDLKINTRTGRAASVPIKATTAHSPKEHWKQQLDGLLANGTIDRAEYRALMNRKF